MPLKKYVKEENKEEKVSSLSSDNKALEKAEDNIHLTIEEKKMFDEIEGYRKDYLAYTSKQKKYSYLLTVGVLVVMVVCFILFLNFPDSQGVSIGAIGLMIAVLIVSFVLSKNLKNKMTFEAEKYIEKLFNTQDAYLFSKEKTDNFLITSKGQFSDEEFKKAHLYKEIEGSKGRNLVTFEHNKNVFKVCDFAANKRLKGRTMPRFLGKLYSIKLKSHVKGISIFQLKGKELSDPLDDFEDLKNIENNEKYLLFSNDANVSKIFNSELIKELTSFKIESPLIDVILSIRDDTLVIGIDYEDQFLNIPVDKSFNIKYSQVVKKHYEKVISIVEIVENNLKRNTETK